MKRELMALALSFLLIGMVGAYQEDLRGDLSQLSTDVTTETTGAGVPVAALNGLQVDVDALETGLMPDIAATGARISYVTATYTSSMSGANNDIVFTANPTTYGGVAGNSVDVQLTDPGTDTTACSVAVDATPKVTVTLSYGSGAIDATAQDVMDCIAASTAASAVVTCANCSLDSGAGVVTALAKQDLSGGIDGTAGTVGQVSYYSDKLYYLQAGTTTANAVWRIWYGAGTTAAVTMTEGLLIPDDKCATFGVDDATIKYDGTTDNELEITCANGISVESATTFDSTVAVASADELTVNSVIVPQELILTWPVAAASADESIFIAADAWVITHIEEVHTVAGSDGSAVTLGVKKCTGTEAPTSGDALHNATIDLKAATDTVQAATLTDVTSYLTLADGDRVALDYSGTKTALAGGSVTIHMRRA